MPAIFEFLPYRQSDGTAVRDAAAATPTSPATATPACASTCAAPASPTACSTTSTCPQEQDDACEVIAWIAEPAVVHRRGRHDRHLVGRLQRAAGRRPPAAGAEGDHHALLDRRSLRRRRPLHGRAGRWARHAAVGGLRCSLATAGRPTPRSSASAGARCGSSGCDASQPLVETWLGHQRRDAYWKQGSVCEDYSAIKARRLRRRRLAGRLHERHPAAARRACRCPRKGLIGPWAHAWPQARPPRPGDRLPAGDRCAGGTTG